LTNLLSQVKGPTQSFQSVWPLFMNTDKMNLPPGSILKNWASCSRLHQSLHGLLGFDGAKSAFFSFTHFQGT